jgi:hypothetical protein
VRVSEEPQILADDEGMKRLFMHDVVADDGTIGDG